MKRSKALSFLLYFKEALKLIWQVRHPGTAPCEIFPSKVQHDEKGALLGAKKFHEYVQTWRHRGKWKAQSSYVKQSSDQRSRGSSSARKPSQTGVVLPITF